MWQGSLEPYGLVTEAMHLCGRIQWNVRWLQVSEGREQESHTAFFFFPYTCCCSFETGNSNSVLFLQWQLPLLLTMKWYICYPGVYGSQRSSLGGAQEWPWSLSSPGRWRRRLTLFCGFFFPFLSYGVVRNTLNKYWWHFSFAWIKIYEPQEIDLEVATNQCGSERAV